VLLPPAGVDEDWILAGNASRFPDQPEMAVLMRIDGGRWLSALITYGRMDPPAGHEQMLSRMARCLPDPLSGQVRAAEPQSELVRFGKAINRRRRFDKLERWPERLVVLGDAACTLNPRYGQGMTVAALGVETLEEQLESHWRATGSLDGLSRRFQRRLARVLSTPWGMAIVEDRLWGAKLAGKKTGLLDSLVVRASSRMLDTVFGDIDTYVTFIRVAHMLDAPSSLMSPKTMAKFCFAGLRSAGAESRS
jgi:2-polyprenyl-6-methoxyphenol hydroxylase-like FAD-dependent oxidoreductase